MDKRGIVHDNDNLDTTLASKDDWLNKINDYGQQFRIEKKKESGCANLASAENLFIAMKEFTHFLELSFKTYSTGARTLWSRTRWLILPHI